jgi:DMSO/TMAO reductase YedYZ molybdopterin-dependent catalytic subunit
MKFLSSLKTIALITFLLISILTTSATIRAQAASTSTQWTLNINGLVQQPLNLTLEDLEAMPQTTEEATIYCVDFPTQIVTTGIWTGVSLATLLKQAGVQPSAFKVAFFAADQYATDLDLASAKQSGVMVAYAKDGAPLAETLRLVVPGRYGYKWISQLTTITLVDYNFLGKWESQGYSDDAYMQSNAETPPPRNVPSFGNPTQTDANTTATPSPGSVPSNTSAASPPQDTDESTPGIQPQTSSGFPMFREIFIAVIVVIVCSSLLAYVFRHRRLKSPA